MINIKHVTLGFLIFLIGGCEFLDYDERSYNRKDDVFEDFDRTRNFLTNIYSYLPTDFGSIDGALRASATDEAEHVWDLSNVQRFNDGTYSAIQPLDNVWGNMYSGIRAVNRFLQETDEKEFEEQRFNLDYEEMMEQYDNYPYEARFLRAYFYFELIKRYKNIPLITSVLTPEEAIEVEQADFGDVVDFIVAECDEVSQVLPIDYSNFSSVQETGRVTRGAALALKSRVKLYAASPLFNQSNNISLWQEAALAAKAVIDSGWYSLASNFNNVVNNRTNPELILERRQAPSNAFERMNFPIGYEGGGTGTCPTQNLVDAFEMSANGLPIEDSNSGYNPNDPYTGRDSRLNATVILNNSTWKGRIVEAFQGGLNGSPRQNATKTGYYLKKYVIEEVSLEPTNTSSREHVYVLFRLAEIFLNYAEAMNEAYGPEFSADNEMTALQAVNRVRNRASMPDFPTGMSQAEFREKLRNERRVELAFEDHRFWDIRRWDIGESTREIYGVRIIRNMENEFEYEKFLLENRVFERRMNLYPIPQSEIFKNQNLIQNTGW